MKKVLFTIILFSLFGEIVVGQSSKYFSKLTIEEAFRPRMPTQMDTIYYPFYNGVQMIEVDQIGFWDKKIFYLEQSNPRAMPHSRNHPMPTGNEYFFRDTSGSIIKAFNTKYSLFELTEHFKKIPIDKKSLLTFLFPYHKSQDYRYNGVWTYSPNYLFNFQGHYKVSNGVAQHESNYPMQNSDFRDIQKNKFGLIDSLGNIKIPIEYDEIIPWYNNLLVQKNEKWGILNYEQKAIVSLKYDNKKFDGYSGSVSPDKMRNIFFLSLKREEDYEKYYTYDAVFISSKNELIPLNNYDEIYMEGSWSASEDYSKRVIHVTKNGKLGLLNADYQEIVSPQYEIFDYNKYEKGLFRVGKEGKFGFWDKNFKEIIPLEYDYAEYFRSDSIALVLKNGEFYCIDNRGKKQPECKLRPEWRTAHLGFVIDKNYVSVKIRDVYGIIDTSSNSIILPIKYESFTPIEINDFFDRNKTIFEQKKFELDNTPDMYDEILFHNNKIIAKNKNNQYGVIDTAFRVLIDFKYEKLEAVQYNLKYLIYSLSGKPGVIDFSGKNILTSKYEEIRYNMHYKQERDILQVKKKGKWGIVDFENKTLVPYDYDSIRFLGHWNRPLVKLWVVEKNKKFGVVNDKNEIFIPFEYDGISHLNGTTLWVIDKDKNRYKVELRE